MVTGPYPALSSGMISPPLFTTVIAWANDRHGLGTVHAFKSLPFPETNTRADCPRTVDERRKRMTPRNRSNLAKYNLLPLIEPTR